MINEIVNVYYGIVKNQKRIWLVRDLMLLLARDPFNNCGSNISPIEKAIKIKDLKEHDSLVPKRLPYCLTRLMVGVLGGIVLLIGLSSCGGGKVDPTPIVEKTQTYTQAVSLNFKDTTTAQPSRTPTQTQTPIEKLEIGSKIINPKDNAKIVYVPAGEFLMGSEDSVADSDEAPEHTVYMDAFWIYKHEVTNAQFAEFVTETSYETDAEKKGWNSVYKDGSWTDLSGAYWARREGPGSEVNDMDDYPVVHVSWNDADAYCKWAGGRLPKEAEWEKAARGTDGRTYPWGDTLANCSLAQYWDCDGKTTKVDSHPDGASPYGAMDMAGNVDEWVNDWYTSNYYSQSVSLDNPEGPSHGTFRVLRGGSWSSYWMPGAEWGDLRVSNRLSTNPNNTGDTTGFRCILDETKETTSITPTSTLTLNPTSFTPETDIEGYPVCVVIDPETSIGPEIFENTEFQNDILDYLNAGGNPLELPQRLSSDAAAQEPNLITVYQPDFNSDQIPDVLMTITLPYGGGSGESHVYMFICRNGQYETHTLFRRMGAGIQAEGLYEGGGAQIERLDDLNKSGNIEILFSVNWPWYADYFLITWENDQFHSLISYVDELGFQRSYFEVNHGNFNIEDVDGDGIIELLVIPTNSQTMEIETWYWDGEQYQLPDE